MNEEAMNENEGTQKTSTEKLSDQSAINQSQLDQKRGISNALLKDLVEAGKASAQAFLESLISLQDDQLLIYALNDRSDYITTQLPLKYHHFILLLEQQVSTITELPTYQMIQGRLFSPYEATLLDLCQYFTLSFYQHRFGTPSPRIKTRIHSLLLDQPPNNYYQDEFQYLSVADLVENPLPSSADVSVKDYPSEGSCPTKQDNSDGFEWLDRMPSSGSLYETPEGELKEITIELAPADNLAARLSPDAFMQKLSISKRESSNSQLHPSKSRLSRIKFKSLAVTLMLLSLFALLLSIGTTAL